MYKITDEAGDVWEAFQGKDEVPLWQIQLDHPQQRSITFSMRDSFNDFLRSAGDGVPSTLQEIERSAGVRLVIADRADPEEVGYIQWRPAFYVAGCIKNFLYLLDNWFQYKEKAVSRLGVNGLRRHETAPLCVAVQNSTLFFS